MSANTTPALFQPVKLGDLAPRNRIVMAPLTRSRSTDQGVPPDFAADYYAQRAAAGLIVTEATNISAQARGYALTPGIWTAEQVASWQRVTRAVHARGGLIVLQLWHTGRISHPSLHGGALPVAPSAIAAERSGFHERRSAGPRDTARAGDRRDTADRRRLPSRRQAAHAMPASTASKFIRRTIICSNSSSATPPTAAPTSTAARSRIACVFRCKSSPP